MTKPNKSVEGWGIRSEQGHIALVIYSSPEYAQDMCVFDEDEVIRVRLIEIPTAKASKGRAR